MEEPLLATYGTLRRAFGRQETLGIADALSFVSPCQFKGILYDLDTFPGAVPEAGTVRAELFRLQSTEVWRILDRYEGYMPAAEDQSLFVRRRTPLRTPAGYTAWVYWYTGSTKGSPRVPGGDWCAHVNGRDEE